MGVIDGIEDDFTLPPNSGSNVTVSTDDIYKWNPEGYRPISGPELKMLGVMDKYYDNPSTGALPESTYFPGANRSINVGTYSGQTFSAPVFAGGGGLFPLGVLDAREKALQTAAFEKQKQLRAFDVKPLDVKNKNYTQRINEDYFNFNNNMVAEAKKYYGKNWRYALTEMNPEDPNSIAHKYQTGLRNYQLLTQQANQLFDVVGATLKDAEDPEAKKYISPEQIQLAEQIQNGLANMSGSNLNQQNLSAMANKLSAERALTAYLKDNKILDSLKPVVDTEISRNPYKSTMDYDLYKTTVKKSIETQVDALAENIKNDAFANSDYYTKDKIKSMLQSMIGDEVEQKLTVARKNKPDSASGTSKEDAMKSLANNTGFNVITTNTYDAKGNVKPKTEGFTTKGYLAFGKDYSGPITLSGDMVDLSTNQKVETSGVPSKANISGIGIVPVFKQDGKATEKFKGVIATEDDIANLEKRGFKVADFIEYKVMVPVSYEEEEKYTDIDGAKKTEKTRKVQKSVAAPIDNVENMLVGEEAATEVYKQQAAALNQQLQSTSTNDWSKYKRK